MELADVVRKAIGPSRLTYSDEELEIFSPSKYIGAAVSFFALIGIAGPAIACIGLALDPPRTQLKSVVVEAAKDAATRDRLAAQMLSKDLTTGDDKKDRELAALLQTSS